MHRATAILALALAAGAAQAQSTYIDMDHQFGFGYGEPSMGFNGPAGVLPSSAWSYITHTTPTTTPVYDLMGNPTAATVTRSLSGGFASFNNAATWGDYQSCFDDYQELASGTHTYTFNNLEPGKYAIYTSAVHPANSNNRCTVSVQSPAPGSQPSQVVGGALTQFSPNRTTLRAGLTHALHIKQITAGQPLTVTITDGVNSSAVCNGIQLVKLTGDRMRIYVDSSATDGLNDGATWQNAFTDLQFALDAARAAGGDNCEIWVASGMYKPGNARTDTFRIPSNLHIYGGFDGDETDLSQRNANPLNTPTYLSGSIGSSSATDDCYTVVTMEAVSSLTLIDGFYIARGYNTDTGRGGGMVIDYGLSPTIRNCSFTTNQASIGGGALHLKSATCQIINTTFYNNTAFNGAGGAIESVGPMVSTAAMQNCRFLGNHALGDGGAIYSNGVNIEIANSLFSGNTSSNEAGAIKSVGDTQMLRLRNCTFSRNSSQDNTGGIYATNGLDVEMHNSILWGNTGGLGGTATAQQISLHAGSGSILIGANNTIEGQHADPRFVDADGPDNTPGDFDDNCRLLQWSPCIDAGAVAGLDQDWADLDGDGVTNEWLPIDLDAKARRVDVPSVLNTGSGGNPMPDRGCFEFQLAQWCYANCDNSSAPPILNVQDFSCFLNKFAEAHPYANCDGSTIAPVTNIQDFACFLNKFAAGCS